jgi:hypothetical protein
MNSFICIAMSSHHFVKEGQEPALLILESTSYSDTEGMLEWAPLVMVVESVLEAVLLWGIKIDVVVAHPENEAVLTSRLADQAPIKIFAAGDNLIESSFLFIDGTGQHAVSIVVSDLIEELREQIERFAGRTQVTVRTPTQKWSFLPSGHFKKWYQAGAIVDFFKLGLPTAMKAMPVSGQGYELTEDQWITIENQAPFWISEQL